MGNRGASVETVLSRLEVGWGQTLEYTAPHNYFAHFSARGSTDHAGKTKSNPNPAMRAMTELSWLPFWRQSINDSHDGYHWKVLPFVTTNPPLPTPWLAVPKVPHASPLLSWDLPKTLYRLGLPWKPSHLPTFQQNCQSPGMIPSFALSSELSAGHHWSLPPIHFEPSVFQTESILVP